MKIFDIFKKKEPEQPFKVWSDLPEITGRNFSDSDFKKKYGIKTGLNIIVGGREAVITQVRTDMITYKFKDDSTPHRDSGAVYFVEFNEYKIQLVDNKTVDNFVSYDSFLNAVYNDDFDLIVRGIELHSVTDNVLNYLKEAARNNKLESVKAFIEYGNLLRYKISEEIFGTATSQGHFEIVKLMVEKGLDPSCNDNMAIQVVGDNTLIREFLLQDQRVIDKLMDQGYDDLLPDSVKDIFIF